MTFNNEIPSFYNKANQKSINGESHCFNVSVETKVPLLSKCQYWVAVWQKMMPWEEQIQKMAAEQGKSFIQSMFYAQ